MFGSDYPSLPYERIFKEWRELGYSDAVMEKIFHANADRVLGLARGTGRSTSTVHDRALWRRHAHLRLRPAARRGTRLSERDVDDLLAPLTDLPPEA